MKLLLPSAATSILQVKIIPILQVQNKHNSTFYFLWRLRGVNVDKKMRKILKFMQKSVKT
jgi:hypothetical protein